jgi:hypothetical protein
MPRVLEKLDREFSIGLEDEILGLLLDAAEEVGRCRVDARADG